MTLGDVFRLLETGELSKILIGNADDGGIYPYHTEQVVGYIQLALSDLHTKFTLRTNEAVIQQEDNITIYHLRRKYASTNDESTEEVKYIKDSESYPFEEDVLQIFELWDEDGCPIPLNNPAEANSAFTPSFDTVQFCGVSSENAVSVVYRADHRPLQIPDGGDPDDVDVTIPSSLLPALLLYVGYRAHTSVGSPEGIQQGLDLLQKYEMTCNQVEILGVINRDKDTNENFRRGGWV